MTAMETTYKSNDKLVGVRSGRSMQRRSLMRRSGRRLGDAARDVSQISTREKLLNKICLTILGLAGIYFIAGIILR